MTLKGGPALKARLAAIPAGAPQLVALWAEDAAERMRRSREAATATRPASKQWEAKAQGNRAGVYGAFWWVFVDRGTKAHDIEARKGKALRFEWRGRTVFAKKVHRKRMARRPFITKAAQEAFASSRLMDGVVKLWNRRRIGSRKAFL